MSWVKRRGPNTPSPAPPLSMYNPNQHSVPAVDQWPNQPTHDNWYSQQQYQPLQNQENTPQQQQNYWQQTYNAPNYNQHYGQLQPQQQQQQYNQYATGNFPENVGYNQQVFGNVQYNQHYPQNYGQPQDVANQQNEGDAWNQAWGDEENSNVRAVQQSGNNSSRSGNVSDAFPNDESWNWAVEDNLSSHPSQNAFPRIGELPKRDLGLSKPTSTQEQLQLKRGKLETPQWSTESQVSQESSDDVLPTSESDKSHMLSRNSTKSHSPTSRQDSEMGSHSEDVSGRNETFENLSRFKNKEILSGTRQELQHKTTSTPPPPPLPPKNIQTPPLMPSTSGSLEDSKNPYKRASGVSHKTPNKYSLPGTSTSQNDVPQNLYKPSFHNQQVNLETVPDNSEQPDPMPSLQYQKIIPLILSPENNEVPINDRNQYLETGQLSQSNSENFSQISDAAPDSSDTFPPPGLRRMVLGQLEQNEIGGNLSNYSQVNEDLQIEGNDTLPPPGLRRMVPGQLEQNEMIRGNIDEPPIGLSRMVLGQTETSSNIQITSTAQSNNVSYETAGPPEGLHRMVPGESSSPESHQRASHLDENDSEPEFQQLIQHTPQPRSATIGADTPPSVIPGQSGTSRSDRSSGSHGAQGTTSLTVGRNEKSIRKSSHSASKESTDQGSRRDSIEGQTQDNEMSNITNSIRNLAVGENLTDIHASNTSLPEHAAARLGRQESSDSEKDHKKPPRVPRDKRSAERTKRDKDRDKNRDRDRDLYSPDNYRDKKYDRRRYRDRRYEDETEDFYSDREKDRERYERDQDYERKYNSLCKEKSKEKYRREPREYRRAEYYYERDRGYDDNYENYENRSRPSSRSDSIHESYLDRQEKERRDKRQIRERDRERDRYRRQRDRRDVYNPYESFSTYDPYHPYYQQYQYFENLRRTNPQAYSEWYRKYYQQATGQASSYVGEDRASVHSGRSSANDELAKDRYMKQSFYSNTSLDGLDMSNYTRQADMSFNAEDTTLAARFTPAKFSTTHLKASIGSGKLLRVLPCYPIDGQNATIEICSLQSLLVNDEEFRELSVFPGPLIKGVTHKKTIIEYCEHKIKYALYKKEITDPDSYILMWELLILLIRQNGMVVGADIAELLLKNTKENYPQRPSSSLSSIGSNIEDVNSVAESRNQNEHVGGVPSNLKEEEVTNKFREFLLYGSAQEALEWAMKHGLWGHALFLASKLDKRTYANIMMRFANGLTMNDPLQTLYQLLSGTMPAAVTCVSDEKWGDWRPHLAMILSNSTQRPELNRKAITTLGDTLRNRDNLYAAQFCYLMAEVGFGRYDDPETRLVLLGADRTKQFPNFVASESIHMTEIYEYACELNVTDFIIPQFQVYKYLLATRLADRGLLEKALMYLEKLAVSIIANPMEYSADIVNNVCNLSEKLKFYDPVGEVEDESQFGAVTETSRPDHSWLRDLRSVQENFQAGLIYQQDSSNFQNYPLDNLEMESSQQVTENNVNEDWQQQYQQNVSQQQMWQPDQITSADYQHQENQLADVPQSQFIDQQQWNEQMVQYNQESIDQHQNMYGGGIEETIPQITMPNQRSQHIFEDEPKNNSSPVKNQSPAKSKLQTPAQEKTQSTGWFGGIFSKLSLRPKNQMKLPDDKNPKIVWDEAKKKWVNIDEDSTDPTNELKPPPKMSDIKPQPIRQDSEPIGGPAMPTMSSSQTNLANYSNISRQPESLPISSSATEEINPLRSSQANNMFKMQRGRNLKNSYVDVFNSGGKSSGPSSLPAPDSFGSTSAPQMNFFVPPPVSNPDAPVDFLSSGGGGW